MPKNTYDGDYYRRSSESEDLTETVSDAKRSETDFLSKIFRPQPGTALLDIGCGTGEFLKSLEDEEVALWGIDISNIATDLSRQKVDRPDRIICGDAETLPFDEDRFDYVTAWGVIEHFPDLDAVLGEIVRVLKPQGESVIMVPNSYYYKFVWDTLRKGTGPVKHQKIERLYAFQEWTRLLEGNGLRVVRTERHNKFNKSKFTAWIKKAIPFYFSNHFIFFCRKDIKADGK